MASPIRRPAAAARRDLAAEFALLDSLGTPGAASTARGTRLRVAAAPELVTDDDHPDFTHLPRLRGRR